MTPTDPCLLIDAAGPLVQTGLWSDGRWEAWEASREEAGRSLFRGVSAILAQSNLSLEDLGGFLFCEGPGSMLGIRIGSMAIRGWQALLDPAPPVFVYNSHEALARILLAKGIPAPFHIISDARRHRWNVLAVPEGAEGERAPLQRVDSATLAGTEGPFFRMEEAVRSEPPVEADMIPYNLKNHAPLFRQPEFLRRCTEPDILVQEAPEYKKWTPERHRPS